MGKNTSLCCSLTNYHAAMSTLIQAGCIGREGSWTDPILLVIPGDPVDDFSLLHKGWENRATHLQNPVSIVKTPTINPPTQRHHQNQLRFLKHTLLKICKTREGQTGRRQKWAGEGPLWRAVNGQDTGCTCSPPWKPEDVNSKGTWCPFKQGNLFPGFIRIKYY